MAFGDQQSLSGTSAAVSWGPPRGNTAHRTGHCVLWALVPLSRGAAEGSQGSPATRPSRPATPHGEPPLPPWNGGFFVPELPPYAAAPHANLSLSRLARRPEVTGQRDLLLQSTSGAAGDSGT